MVIGQQLSHDLQAKNDTGSSLVTHSSLCLAVNMKVLVSYKGQCKVLFSTS